MLLTRKTALKIIFPHLATVFWLLVLGFLQIQWPRFLTFGGIKPNLLLIFLFYRVLGRTPLYGAFWGFIVGLFLNVYSTGLLGFLALTYALTGILIGWLKQWFYLGKLKIQIGALFLIIMVYEIIFFMIYRFLYVFEGWYLAIYRILLPEVLYTLLLGAVFLAIMSKIRPSPIFMEEMARF